MKSLARILLGNRFSSPSSKVSLHSLSTSDSSVSLPSPWHYFPPFGDPFFLIAADENGDFIIALLWIIMWCNWSPSPIGGALFQLVQLEAALLAQAEVFVQLRSQFDSVPFTLKLGSATCCYSKSGWPTAALPLSIVLHGKSKLIKNSLGFLITAQLTSVNYFFSNAKCESEFTPQ